MKMPHTYSGNQIYIWKIFKYNGDEYIVFVNITLIELKDQDFSFLLDLDES